MDTEETKVKIEPDDEFLNLPPLPLKTDKLIRTEFKIIKSPKKEVEEIPDEFETVFDLESNLVEIKEEIEEKPAALDPLLFCKPVLLSTKKKKALKKAKVFKCSTCDLKFFSQNIQHIHEKFTHPEKPNKLVKCSKCPLEFLANIHLKKHIKVLHNYEGKAKKHKCSLCPKRFVDKARLHLHKLRVHFSRFSNKETTTEIKIEIPEVANVPEAKFKCFKCDLTFTTTFRLQNHEYSAHPVKKEFKCSTCDLKFSSENIQQLHEKFTHKKNLVNIATENVIKTKSTLKDQFPCPHCPKSYQNKYNLTSHKNRVHPEAFPEEEEDVFEMKPEDFDEKTPNLNFKCPNCTEKFETKGLAVQHWRTHGSAHPCPLCPASFKGKGGLIEHRSNVHNQVFPASSPKRKKIFKCSKCEQIFANFFSLSKHEEHHGDKYPCQLCPAVFQLRRYVLSHRKKAHPECQEEYKYNRHTIKEQPGNYFYKCMKCPLKFVTPREAIEHEKSHGYNWPCDFCDSIFETSHGMKAHRGKFHPECTQNKCSKCDLTFPNYWSYQKHMSSKHRKLQGEIRFTIKCWTCNITFRTLLEKAKHEEEVCRKKVDFYCQICLKSFKTKQWFTIHNRKVHRDFKKKHSSETTELTSGMISESIIIKPEVQVFVTTDEDVKNEFIPERMKNEHDFDQKISPERADFSAFSGNVQQDSEQILESIYIKPEEVFVTMYEDVKEELIFEPEDQILGI